MTDYSELKRLAEGMKGWDKMTECWPCDENGPDWQVGRLDEDDNRWPLLTIDTEQYDQEREAPKIARYYAAANPAAVLALIAERDQLFGQTEQLKAENERLRKLPTCWSEVLEQSEANDELLDKVLELSRDAERYRWLRDDTSRGKTDFCITKKYWGASTPDVILELESADEQIDAAMGKGAKS